MFSPGFLRDIRLVEDRITSCSYPYNIPAIQNMGILEINSEVTILVGENGTGKSTIIEGLAVALGFNAEGGSKNFNFATRNSESILHHAIQVRRGIYRETDGFFLRAESMYNLATNVEQLGVSGYGRTPLHHQSHGESFLALALNRFRGNGLYLLDEPESALSPARQLSFLQLMHHLVSNSSSQFIIATHSPIFMAFPGATIYLLNDGGISKVAYEDTEHYQVTRDFLANPDAFLHHLFNEINV